VGHLASVWAGLETQSEASDSVRMRIFAQVRGVILLKRGFTDHAALPRVNGPGARATRK